MGARARRLVARCGLGCPHGAALALATRLTPGLFFGRLPACSAGQTLEVFSEKPKSGFSSVAFPTLLNTARSRAAAARLALTHALTRRTRRRAGPEHCDEAAGQLAGAEEDACVPAALRISQPACALTPCS